MNKYLPFLLVNIIALWSSNVFAGSKLMEDQTQTNKQTGLFKESIEDYDDFTKQLEDGKLAAKDSLGGEEGNSAAFGVLSKEPRKKIEAAGKQAAKIDAHDLHSKGTAKMHEEKVMDELYPDYNRSLQKANRKDAQEIAEGQADLMANLLKRLDEHTGINCRTVKGDKKKEPVFYLRTKKEQHKDTVYNQTMCEEPRRTYICHDDLTLNCLDFSENANQVNIINSTIPSKFVATPSSVNREYTSYSFLLQERFSGPRTTNSLVTFAVSGGKETMSRLELVDIRYRSFILIKLNGVVVFSGPRGGSTLQITGTHEEVTKGRRRYLGAVGPRKKHTTYYPVVSTGSGQYILGLDGGVVGPHLQRQVNLLPYFREGNNMLEVTAIGDGEIVTQFMLNSSERICRNWRKDWSERCALK